MFGSHIIYKNLEPPNLEGDYEEEDNIENL